MPLLAYHSSLPLDFWDIWRSLVDAMTGLVWYLTAFLASSSLWSGGVPGVKVVSAQYLLGLGEHLSACENRDRT